jgi:uncharacterized low-complexity protein
MSKINARHPVGMIGVALAGLVLGGSAFAVEPLSQGYMLAASHAAAEGKCGEGKCGGTPKAAKPATPKAAEGKCGEGQCGDARFASADTDKDHLVSRAEFLAVVPNGDAIFASKDPNGDGFISEKEAYQNVKKAYDSNGKKMPQGLFADIQD